MRSKRCLVLLCWGSLLLAACGSADDGGQAQGPDAAASDAAADGCQLPALTPSWLQDAQDEWVAKLTGEQAIGGTTLTERFSAASRSLSRNYLAAELTSMGYSVGEHNYGGGINLVASLAGEGARPQVYLFGAHYDSVSGSPGANDNATGVAVLLSAARYLREVPCREHDMQFVLFDEEELGLVGSRAYAQELAAAGQELAGVWTIDQMGWDMDGDRRVEIELPAPGMLAQVQATSDAFDLGIGLLETATSGTDHTAFREQGYAAAGITEEYVSGDTTPHYHQASDAYDTIDFDYVASTSALVHGLLARLVQDQGA